MNATGTPTTPLTEMLELFRVMNPHGLGKSQRFAKKFKNDPADLAGRFLRSVEHFGSYSNIDQGFHDKPTIFKAGHGLQIQRTVDLGQRLSGAGDCAIPGTDLAFTYVDRELDCMRTYPGQKLEDGEPSKRAIVLDLLLRHKDGTPILAELKIREDADAFYGLVQALAAAAHLVTEKQLERLAKQYPVLRINEREPRVDICVLLYPAGRRKGTRVPLLKDAQEIALGFLAHEGIGKLIRDISFVDARLDDEQLNFRPARDLKLHEAMVAILQAHPGWMDRDELAREIAGRDLYRRKDGSIADGDQMRLRAQRPEHAGLFECSDTRCSKIRLRTA